MKSLIASITILFFSSLAHADAPPIILEDRKEFYEIGLNLDFLEDPSRKLTINDVNQLEWAGKFKRSKKNIPNYGYSKSAYWFRFKIQNFSKQKEWLLAFNVFYQNHIEFYKKKMMAVGLREY